MKHQVLKQLNSVANEILCNNAEITAESTYLQLLDAAIVPRCKILAHAFSVLPIYLECEFQWKAACNEVFK